MVNLFKRNATIGVINTPECGTHNITSIRTHNSQSTEHKYIERQSPVNDPASVQQTLQPLQGSVEQAAPPTTSSSQTGASSGTTASGNNASQSSSQDNATGSNVSNNSTVTLEVFSYNLLVLYSNRGLLVVSCCPKSCFPGYVFSCFSGAGFLDLAMGAHGR